MASERPVKEMCEDCGWKRRSSCKVITDPKWIFNHRKGNCFAKVTPEKAEEIENNLIATMFLPVTSLQERKWNLTKD